MPLEFNWPFSPSTTKSIGWKVSSKVILSMVGFSAKLLAEWCNTFHVHNKEGLIDAVSKRPPHQPLLTVCNHTSCMDDPILFGMLNLKHLTTENHLLRWTNAASDICFTKAFHSWFFARGRVVPIVRGEGVYQHGMNFMIDKLDEGQWVHTFPEGKINLTHEFLRLKWGVGRMIAESKLVPLVIPFWHVGMDDLLPNTKPYIPRIGKHITVVIGEALDFSELLQNLRNSGKSPMEVRKTVTDQIQEEFLKLKTAAEKLHQESVVHSSS